MAVKIKKTLRGPQLRVYPYKQGSKSAKTLADVLNAKVLKHVGSKFQPRAGDVVVNWGSSNLPVFEPATTLNTPEAVKVASCKKASFIKLFESEVRVPDFVVAGQDRVNGKAPGEAAANMGFPVVCRTKLNGHSGEGIVIANNADELVDAPLYTKYIKKKDEYRVHVVDDTVIFVQRKARKLDVEDPNWQVRNLAGGFCFAEVGIQDNFERYDHRWDCPSDVLDQARDAVEALGLDFGGVDVMWNEKEGKAYVLEVNTACGLEDRTAQKYGEAFRAYFEAEVG